MVERIAVITSGGDVPGLNACIRAIVQTAAHRVRPTVFWHRASVSLPSMRLLQMLL